MADASGRGLPALPPAEAAGVGETWEARGLIHRVHRRVPPVSLFPRPWRFVPGLIILHVLLTASPVFAHKAIAFAAVEGKMIQGEAYFRDGAPIRNAQVAVFNPAGERLGETRTDPSGKFSFEPRMRCDHRFVVDGGDGHAAQFTVRSEELPAGLAGAGSTPEAGRGRDAVPAKDAKPTAVDAKSQASGASGVEEVRASDALHGELEAIQAQIVQLRRELAQREDATQWRDVLGGIGYVLGLMGLAFYFLGVRRKTARGESQG